MGKQMLIQTLINVVMQFASPEVMKMIVDKLLDVIEEAVERSGTPVDDMIVLPVVRQVRQVFDIPDNDV